MILFYTVLKHSVALSPWDEFAIGKQKYGARVPPTWRHTAEEGGRRHNFTRYSKSSVAVIRMMSSDFANFYYMLDAQLFLRPQFIRRRKHSRHVNLSSGVSRCSQNTCIPVMMWLTKEISYVILPLVRKSFFFTEPYISENLFYCYLRFSSIQMCDQAKWRGILPTVICAGMFSSARCSSPVEKLCF